MTTAPTRLNGLSLPKWATRFNRKITGQPTGMGILLLILGIVLIVAGVLGLLRGQLLWGIVLLVVGIAVAPGHFYIG